MNRGLINRIVELQTRLSRLEGKTYIQFQVVRNNTVPLELLREVIYYNYETNEFIYFNPLTRQSEKISIGYGTETGGMGMFAFEIENGDLILLYEDNDTPPNFELTIDGDLIYILEEDLNG